MINTKKLAERLLQRYRFKIAQPYLYGDILDFGANREELRQFVKGNYFAVNHDHSLIQDKKFDTIVALAVIEHIEYADVFEILKMFRQKHLKPGGKVFLTIPTKISKPILEFMATAGLLDRDNIAEHKHYWDKKEVYELAEKSGFVVEKYKKFQCGLNQLVLFKQS